MRAQPFITSLTRLRLKLRLRLSIRLGLELGECEV
jgi:hypothetical protein